MKRAIFHTKEEAEKCADHFLTYVYREPLESVGLEDREPDYYVSLTDREYKEWYNQK